jgi:hypothetical protein
MAGFFMGGIYPAREPGGGPISAASHCGQQRPRMPGVTSAQVKKSPLSAG